MANFSKLIGVAKKALDSRNSSGTGGAGSGAPAGQTDWRSMVRSAADAITGDGRTGPAQPSSQVTSYAAARPASAPSSAVQQPAANVSAEDRAAIARYDYLLQTAEPAAIEQVHREAFERLTPAQREQIELRMRAELPAHEQPRSSEPGDLARTAARIEASRPGMLKGLLARIGGGTGGGAGGGGFGRSAMIGGAVGGTALAAGGILGAVAGGAILSSVAAPLLEQAAGLGVDFDALAGSVDVGALTEGFDGLAGSAGEAVSGLGGQASGFGEQASGFGEQISGLGSSFGLDDIFGR